MKLRLQLAFAVAALTCSVISSLPAHAAIPESEKALLEGVAPLPPEKTEFMSVEDVKAGMRVVAYTVFEGNQVEPFVGRVQGIARNYFGPQRHIIIVRFDGERLKHSGIVHGMSGSPVYIDGKLIGALSLALSPFPKDPLAGVTPIAYMLDEAKDRGLGPGSPLPNTPMPTRMGWAPPPQGAATGSASASSATPPSGAASAAGGGSMGGTSMSGTAGAGATGEGSGRIDRDMSTGSLEMRTPAGVPTFRPLMSPLTFTGVDPEIFDHYRGAFAGFPVGTQLGGGGSGLASQPTPGEVKKASAALQPGSAVAGVLVEGDMTIAATGTVTYRDGESIFAFGHPFLQQGSVAMPMATADVIATVADQTYPYKLANMGTLVGAITHDRLTAVVGRLGATPQMMPLRMTIRRDGEPISVFSYRILEHRQLTPVLLQLVVANSLKKQWRYNEEATYFLKARIKVADGKDVVAKGTYAISGGQNGGSIFDVVKDVADPFTAVYTNPFRPVEMQGVELEIDMVDQDRLYTIEDVYVDRTEIRPGEKVEVKVAIRPHRGERMVKSFSVPIPQGLNGGSLMLKVADAGTVEKTGVVGGRLAPEQARDFDQLITILNRPRSGDRLYVQLIRKAPGVVMQNQQMTTLPGSVRDVLQQTASSEVPGGLDRTVVWEGELSFDGALVGSHELALGLLPAI